MVEGRHLPRPWESRGRRDHRGGWSTGRSGRRGSQNQAAKSLSRCGAALVVPPLTCPRKGGLCLRGGRAPSPSPPLSRCRKRWLLRLAGRENSHRYRVLPSLSAGPVCPPECPHSAGSNGRDAFSRAALAAFVLSRCLASAPSPRWAWGTLGCPRLGGGGGGAAVVGPRLSWDPKL